MTSIGKRLREVAHMALFPADDRRIKLRQQQHAHRAHGWDSLDPVLSQARRYTRRSLPPLNSRASAVCASASCIGKEKSEVQISPTRSVIDRRTATIRSSSVTSRSYRSGARSAFLTPIVNAPPRAPGVIHNSVYANSG